MVGFGEFYSRSSLIYATGYVFSHVQIVPHFVLFLSFCLFFFCPMFDARANSASWANKQRDKRHSVTQTTVMGFKFSHHTICNSYNLQLKGALCFSLEPGHALGMQTGKTIATGKWKTSLLGYWPQIGATNSSLSPPGFFSTLFWPSLDCEDEHNKASLPSKQWKVAISVCDESDNQNEAIFIRTYTSSTIEENSIQRQVNDKKPWINICCNLGFH